MDGDGCPYKEDIYKVAKRYALDVFMVCNHEMRIPRASWIKPVIVGREFDAVDDWIVEHIVPQDIVITNDLLLSKRCVDKEAAVLDTRGREITSETIGELLATREIMYELRQMGEMKLGPKPAQPRYRSDFLSHLDEMINRINRAKASKS